MSICIYFHSYTAEVRRFTLQQCEGTITLHCKTRAPSFLCHTVYGPSNDEDDTVFSYAYKHPFAGLFVFIKQLSRKKNLLKTEFDKLLETMLICYQIR